MKIVATICSKGKDDSEGLLPARLRYTSSHNKSAQKIADDEHLPFFILSGKYGLISSEEEIPYYDYYLEEKAVDSLSLLVASQLKENNITEVDFYIEDKGSWEPYKNAFSKGADISGVMLNLRHF